MSYSDADYEEACQAIKILAGSASEMILTQDIEGAKKKLQLIYSIADGGDVPDELMRKIHPWRYEEDGEEENP